MAVASVIGPGAAVVTGGVLTLVGLGVINFAMPEFGRLEMRLDQGDPPD